MMSTRRGILFLLRGVCDELFCIVDTWPHCVLTSLVHAVWLFLVDGGLRPRFSARASEFWRQVWISVTVFVSHQ
mgnify:CR=1 FL=1